MNKQLFKEGDKVYYPLMSNKILTLLKHDEDKVSIDLGLSGYTVFNSKGKKFEHQMTQSIFHATQVKYELLTNLYPYIEFEKPIPVLNETVKQMFDDGYEYIVCDVLLPNGDTIKDIIREYDGNTFYGEYGTYENQRIVPLDTYTGKEIVDYIGGSPILRSE